MAQIMLDRPCVLSVVGEFVAGGVAQHVRVYRELDTGPLSGPPDDLPHRVGGERRLALADEHVSCIRIVPLQAAEGSQLRSTQRVNRRDAVLEPGDMQEPLAEISLIPAQTDEFGHAQAVTVGEKNQRGIPRAMPADSGGRCDHRCHLPV